MPLSWENQRYRAKWMTLFCSIQHCHDQLNVKALASEAKLGGLFLKAKKVVIIQTALQEMKCPQPPMRIQPSNSTAYGNVTNKVTAKAMKAMDMCFQCLCNCEQQEQFQYYWWPEKMNHANCWTNQHPAMYHKMMRAEFLTAPCKVAAICKLVRAKVTTVCNCQQSGLLLGCARIPRNPNPDSRKLTDNSIWKGQQALMWTHHTKYHWQFCEANKNEQKKQWLEHNKCIT